MKTYPHANVLREGPIRSKTNPWKWIVLIILLLGVYCAFGQDLAMLESSSVYGISLPETPKPQPKHRLMDKWDWELLGDDATLRMLDATSTRIALNNGNVEAVLPDCISHHTATMFAYSASVVGFNWMLSQELKRHHHERLAKMVYITDIGVETPSLHNFVLPGHENKTKLLRFK